MTGYTLETRQRVRFSPKLPALTQEQIRRVATPTIIVKRPVRVDEREQRRLDPTLFDLARMTPLQRWQRLHTETLLTPEPGTGIVRRGEVSMPWRKYVEAAAHNLTPPALRVHAVTKLYEHTIAPCEDHVTVPIGEQRVSWKEVKQRFLSHRHKYFTQATHIHDVTLHEVNGQVEWRCSKCHQKGFEDYTLDTLGRTTHLVWHGCVKCMAKDWKPELSRRRFLQWGVGAGLGYAAWVSQFSGEFGIPYVPSPAGAANTYYYATTGSDTTGNGSSGSPYATPEKCRQQTTANNADLVKGRTGTYTPVSFSNSTAWPAGSSYAQAVTCGVDTGHTPVWQGNSGTIIFMSGSTHQYIIVEGIEFDCEGASRVAFAGTRTTLGDTSTAPHHIRFTDCHGHDAAIGNGMFVVSHSHHCEFLDLLGNDIVGGNTGQFIYPPGADNLVAGCESLTNLGYGIHAFSDEAGETTDRSVYRKNEIHNLAGRGILVQPQAGSVTGADILIYYNQIYRTSSSSASGFGAIRLIFQRLTNCNVLNNTIVSNGVGGIKVGRASDGTNVPQNTKLINNISVSNTGFQIEDNGASTTATTNSWQITNFSADFVDSATDDYHLGANSDAIDAGTSVSSTINSGTWALTPLTDFDGTSVPKNSVTDLGALESGAAGEEPPDPPTGGAGVGNDNTNPFRRGRLRRF